MYTIRVFLTAAALLFAFSELADAGVDIRFTISPPANAMVGDEIRAEWASRDSDAQYRYKIDVPGQWMFGIRYRLNQWSEWGKMTSISFSDFVLEGKYTLTVEARNSRGDVKSVSSTFRLSFVLPEARDAGIKIDWARVRAARSDREKYEILASEYEQAYQTWMQIYDGRRRVLRSSYSPQELIRVVSGAVVGRGQDVLLESASKQVAARVSMIMLPKTIYDIAKQSGITIVLIYRNVGTNEAALKAISSYWAHRGYSDLAKRAR